MQAQALARALNAIAKTPQFSYQKARAAARGDANVDWVRTKSLHADFNADASARPRAQRDREDAAVLVSKSARGRARRRQRGLGAYEIPQRRLQCRRKRSPARSTRSRRRRSSRIKKRARPRAATPTWIGCVRNPSTPTSMQT